MTSPDDQKLPGRLTRDLQRLYSHTPAVPDEVERRILWAARPARRRWPAYAVAAAAAVAVATWLTVALGTPYSRPAAVAVVTEPDDVNADGVIDIRDALVLAQSDALRADGIARRVVRAGRSS